MCRCVHTHQHISSTVFYCLFLPEVSRACLHRDSGAESKFWSVVEGLSEEGSWMKQHATLCTTKLCILSNILDTQ